MKARVVDYEYNSVSDWFDVTEEELALLKEEFSIQVDLGKESYLNAARNGKEERERLIKYYEEREKKRLERSKANAEKRKLKMFKKLKEEFGES